MLKDLKQILSICYKADCNCFLEQERTVYSEIHAKMDHNDVRRVLCTKH
jgi:hypothetical protein